MNDIFNKETLSEYTFWILIGLSLTALAASAVFVFLSLKQPLQKEETIYKNEITQKTTFDYKADMAPSFLYPQGGLVTPGKLILAPITKGLQVEMNTLVTSEKPVEAEGTQGVELQLIAQDMWEQDYTLSAQKTFKYDSANMPIYQTSFYIDLKDMLSFIENVYKETKVIPEKLTFKLKPILDGKIVSNGKSYPLDQAAELSFVYKNNILQLEGEKEYSKTTAINDKAKVAETFSALGFSLPVQRARLISCSVFLALLVINILLLKRTGIFEAQTEVRSEQETLDRKYRKRLIETTGVYRSQGREIKLASFRSLLQISDDKELPIFRELYDEENAIYYIADSSCFYTYYPRNGSDKWEEEIVLKR